jgi:hypothetical protein
VERAFGAISEVLSVRGGGVKRNFGGGGAGPSRKVGGVRVFSILASGV